MDLRQRTLETLDWPVVMTALASHTRTFQAADRAAEPDFVETVDAANERYAAVAEVLRVLALDQTVPIGSLEGGGAPVRLAAVGTVLDGASLRLIAGALATLSRLQGWLEAREDEVPALFRLGRSIHIDPTLREMLEGAFDESGALSAKMFPVLGQLRSDIETRKASIRKTLDRLVRGDALSDALQDRFFTERDGRFVLPIKANRRKGVGIVHGTSQSGETVFVEPAAVVEDTNALKEAEGALEREEHRILALLSTAVGSRAEDILASVEAAVEIDLACARAELGLSLDGVVPRVEASGVIQLPQARHPVLVLRAVEVVANDLALDSQHPGLILSGPNAGGKTVSLKTLGMCALMARAGIPVPAAEGARVDCFFPILADIGDLQSVEGDLSTFSGHLVVAKAVLAASAAGALVLLDEVGVGTEPTQGAAIAQAVVEALVDGGARVVVTTHYDRLKRLPEADPRFAVAAVQLIDGQPTYRLQHGHVGDSHALTIARRLALPDPVLARARDLVDEGTRALTDTLAKLDAERDELAHTQAQVQAEAERQDLAQRKLAADTERLDARRKTLVEDVTRDLQQRLREGEAKLKALVRALQQNPGVRLAGETLQALRVVRDEVAEATEGDVPAVDVSDLSGELGPGVTVLVGRSRREATVVAVKKNDRVEVELGNVKMEIPRSDIVAIRPAAIEPTVPTAPSAGGVGVRFAPPSEAKTAVSADQIDAVRHDGNTCDLRGMRVEEALDAVAKFLDDHLYRGDDAVFLLHGHGTGALKAAVRDWLRTAVGVRRWRPAERGEGGDAFTVVEVG